MKTIAIDTNVVLDLFFERPGAKQWQSLFSEAQNGKALLHIPLIVVPETEWILRSYYKLPKPKVIQYITSIVRFNGAEIPDRELFIQTLICYQNTSGVSFVDCMIALSAKRAKVDELITSDRKLKKLYARL